MWVLKKEESRYRYHATSEPTLPDPRSTHPHERLLRRGGGKGNTNSELNQLDFHQCLWMWCTYCAALLWVSDAQQAINFHLSELYSSRPHHTTSLRCAEPMDRKWKLESIVVRKKKSGDASLAWRAILLLEVLGMTSSDLILSSDKIRDTKRRCCDDWLQARPKHVLGKMCVLRVHAPQRTWGPKEDS